MSRVLLPAAAAPGKVQTKVTSTAARAPRLCRLRRRSHWRAWKVDNVHSGATKLCDEALHSGAPYKLRQCHTIGGGRQPAPPLAIHYVDSRTHRHQP
eukprot:scaffold4538_cov410-Prasinococcus_capsulatus_cf.AAC.8